MRDRLEEARQLRHRASDVEWQGNWAEADRLRHQATLLETWASQGQRYEPSF